MINEPTKPSPNAQPDSPDEPLEETPEQFDLPLTNNEPVSGNVPAPRKSFPLGRVVATPAALDFMERHAITAFALLDRHRTCDWGDVDGELAAGNVLAVALGFRILSIYRFGPDNETICVITEADRSATTILRPADY